MNLKISVPKIVDMCSITLLILIFVSKISLKWTHIIPYSFPPLVFQYGMHPYINFGLQFIVAIILIFVWLKYKWHASLSPIYKCFIYSLMILLIVQTIFQIIFIHTKHSTIMQLSGLGMALMLILVYGIIIPTVFDLKKFIFWISCISTTLVFISFSFLPIFSETMFKGGRFIGFFKHIPHMVSASTASFIFLFPSIFTDKKWSIKNNFLLKSILIFIVALVVLLTSTKAAAVTIIIAISLGAYIFGSKKKTIRLFKFSFLACSIISLFLIGIPAAQYVLDITTGKINFGMRKAQDGIQTRTEEITRGTDLFLKSPHFGMGLLYKFLNNSSSSVDVEGYNSFKDPHNFFISAAVIGGYPLLIFSIIGYVLLIFATIKNLGENDINKQIIGLFLFAHLPVFVIYHAHFSLGGIADRLYWPIFGYASQYTNQKNKPEIIYET